MSDEKKKKIIQITEKGKKWVEEHRKEIEAETGMILEEYLAKIGKALEEIKEEVEKEGLMAVVLKYR